METIEEKIAYSIGLRIGADFKQQGIEVDGTIVGQAIADTLSGAEVKLSEHEQAQAMKEMQKMMGEKQSGAGDENKTKGDDFLTAKKAEEGVQATASGLLYKVLSAGDGDKPSSGDTVECHYRGTLIDGKEFDSSYARGESASFPVNGVIQGWQEALPMMPTGSKWELYIPSDLAYGANGAGGDIGPHEALIFEIELLAIK